MERLSAARTLVLIGGNFVVQWSLYIVLLVVLSPHSLAHIAATLALIPLFGPLFVFTISYGPLFYAALMVMLGVLAIVSVVLVRDESPKRVEAGSVIGLIIGIAGILTIAGFLIGSLLFIISGILGLAWKPTATTTTAAQPAQQPATNLT